MAWALQSPMVADGVLYAESSDGHLRALDAATGEELWRFQKGYFDGIPSYTVIGGVLYVGSLDGGVYAFIAPLGTTTEGKVLTILYWQAPTLPGPYLSGGTKDLDAGAITLEPLAKYDPDGNLVPALAAQIPTIENGGFSQDLMSITWKLKEGLKWSDGSDMTAEDVVFTWLYCVDEDTGCTAESSFDGIASVLALDNLTVQIAFDAPTPYPYRAFVGAGTPIISRAQFADCIGAAATTCEAQNTAPLGTGPYRITSFKTNEGAVYERNPFYRGPAPYFYRVVLKGGGDAISAARAVMERGEADYAWNTQVEPEILTRDGSGWTGHSGRRLHQPGGAYRRQPDQSRPGFGRQSLRVSGWTKPPPLPDLQAHSPGHVAGHRPGPHSGGPLRLRRGVRWTPKFGQVAKRESRS